MTPLKTIPIVRSSDDFEPIPLVSLVPSSRHKISVEEIQDKNAIDYVYEAKKQLYQSNRMTKELIEAIKEQDRVDEIFFDKLNLLDLYEIEVDHTLDEIIKLLT